METVKDSISGCVLKCLRNVKDVSHSLHPLKYGVNTIGRGLNNDIVLKNLNVSRTHCHLRVEKKGSIDIAYVKDLGTSNGTIVGNINLKEFDEHELNDLDIIILASGDEGVVLQYINKIDYSANFTNLCNNEISHKRKVFSVDNFDEPTAVKIPKLALDIPSVFKEPFSNENKDVSTKMTISPNIATNIQQINSKQSMSTSSVLESVKDSCNQILTSDKSLIVSSNNTEPSCSYYKNNLQTSLKIKTEQININNVLSQGTYRNEEDSVIVIYSSDEENGLEFVLPNIKIELEKMHVDSKPATELYPSTTKDESKLNVLESPIHFQRNETVSEDDDDDDIIFIPPISNSNNNNTLINSNDSDDDYNSKCPEVFEPLPSRAIIKRGKTKVLVENENVIKTRARSEKIINNKKKAEKMTTDQNKQIIQERRLKLQKLARDKLSILSPEKKVSNTMLLTGVDYINKCSTTEKLKKKTRISRLQNSSYDCIPSTSKLQLATEIDKNITLSNANQVKFNNQEKTSKINFINNISSLSSKIELLNFAYFDTLSIICKWNAVWLREEKFVDKPPPLVKTIIKMKGEFVNPSDYSSSMKPLLLYEIWSKISESYNMILNKNPNLEKYIFEKSLKKDTPLHTFDIQSVNKEFSKSVKVLQSISGPLWCLKCIETNKKNQETLTRPRFSLKGYLCIVIIQSKCFETDAVRVKRPTKSRNIFFAYVNVAKKIGYHLSTQLYIELIVTRKTENIPNGTTIHLMDIFYLHSELRLFQAINNVTSSSLSKALITPQIHNNTLDYSKSVLKSFNINSLTLNNSQKEAVKMAITICSAKEPNVGLIIGPPGTGKTNVICNIILTFMSKHAKTNNRPKLLICAPSNEAVDAIVKRIIEIKKDIKNELQFNIVRVGSGQKYDPHSPIADVMLDNLVKYRMNNPLNEPDQPGQSNTLSIFTNKRDLEEYILKNTDVVLTTLNSCFSKTMENSFMPSAIKTMSSCHFTACIVDEAGQSIEPLNCVPILLGIDKLILVGDDKQLQPLIKSKVAKDNGLGISLFKRLKTWFEHKRYTQKSLPIKILDVQYRMHHEICQFPSVYFYKSLIKTAPSVKKRKNLPFQPYLILEHESQQDCSGEINLGEANMIVSLVEILLNSECKSLDIAVLTPYHKQREKINVLLGNKKMSLNVNTIDSFQGGECDVLLISVVRTNGVGFLDDICRLNVALTRAKQSLIICGNFKSLKGERVWCDLLEDAKKRKLIKKVSKNVFSNSKALLTMIKY